jgi:hypothetical protein
MRPSRISKQQSFELARATSGEHRLPASGSWQPCQQHLCMRNFQMTAKRPGSRQVAETYRLAACAPRKQTLEPRLPYFLDPPGAGVSMAVIRLATVGLERPRLTSMPGLRSVKVARRPLMIISVNWVTVTVFVVFSSVTVMLFGPILEITIACGVGAGVCFRLFPPASADGAANVNSEAQVITNRTDNFTVPYFL